MRNWNQYNKKNIEYIYGEIYKNALLSIKALKGHCDLNI